MLLKSGYSCEISAFEIKKYIIDRKFLQNWREIYNSWREILIRFTLCILWFSHLHTTNYRVLSMCKWHSDLYIYANSECATIYYKQVTREEVQLFDQTFYNLFFWQNSLPQFTVLISNTKTLLFFEGFIFFVVVSKGFYFLLISKGLYCFLW